MSPKKEYKIVLSSDGNFAGKSDRLTWEHVINSYSEESWTVISFANVQFSKSNNSPELAALLERDKH